GPFAAVGAALDLLYGLGVQEGGSLPGEFNFFQPLGTIADFGTQLFTIFDPGGALNQLKGLAGTVTRTAFGVQTLASTEQAFVAAKVGPDLSGSYTFAAPTDPNSINGSPGVGSQHFVPLGALPYVINFDNKATADAPAQVVTVTQQLDATLDWSTLQ